MVKLAAYSGILVLLCICSCSPKAQAAKGNYQAPTKAANESALIGAWGFQENGMNWEWIFAQDGSTTWKIVGQSDMSGKPVVVEGRGSYSFDGTVLLLKLDRFAGLPGMWRSADAAPGFDPSTEVNLHFTGSDSMSWSFTTTSLGIQNFKVTRLK